MSSLPTRKNCTYIHVKQNLPTGHLPAEGSFQAISVDLVEYKSLSISAAGIECKYVLSMKDHLTRFSIPLTVRDKAAKTVAKAIIKIIKSTSGPPETLHSDNGAEFKNYVVYQLQKIIRYKKTQTPPYRPQGKSVSE